MIPLPDDERNRFWVETTNKEDHPAEKDVVGTLVTTDDDGLLEVLGTAFVVYSSGNQAICLGAAHSFHPIKNRQLARSGKGELHIPGPLRRTGPNYIKADGVHVFFCIKGIAIACRITQLNYTDSNDIALFTVVTQDGATPFDKHVAIDIGAPNVGDVVGIASNDISLEVHGEGHGKIDQRFGLRLGTVSEVVLDNSPLDGQSFYFHTTIPVTAGMSGAPIVINPTPNEAFAVCGVVSSDMSKSEAFTSFKVAGRSTGSMIWPAMGLAIDASLNKQPNSSFFLGDLLENNVIDNRSVNVEATVTGSPNATKVTYLDNRNETPVGITLTLPNNPKYRKD
ncbi:MAG: trypsin-like peptidase domain-containing protein [Bacteroidetes bacterium]|nr:trypsin-like peptidase domain-containing protein [Bacteroidota bacterium]